MARSPMSARPSSRSAAARSAGITGRPGRACSATSTFPSAPAADLLVGRVAQGEVLPHPDHQAQLAQPGRIAERTIDGDRIGDHVEADDVALRARLLLPAQLDALAERGAQGHAAAGDPRLGHRLLPLAARRQHRHQGLDAGHPLAADIRDLDRRLLVALGAAVELEHHDALPACADRTARPPPGRARPGASRGWAAAAARPARAHPPCARRPSRRRHCGARARPRRRRCPRASASRSTRRAASRRSAGAPRSSRRSCCPARRCAAARSRSTAPARRAPPGGSTRWRSRPSCPARTCRTTARGCPRAAPARPPRRVTRWPGGTTTRGAGSGSAARESQPTQATRATMARVGRAESMKQGFRTRAVRASGSSARRSGRASEPGTGRIRAVAAGPRPRAGRGPGDRGARPRE